MHSIDLISAQDVNMLERCLRVREVVFILEKNMPKETEPGDFDC